MAFEGGMGGQRGDGVYFAFLLLHNFVSTNNAREDRRSGAVDERASSSVFS